MKTPHSLCALLLASAVFSSCSSSRNINNDVNSSNPMVAEQAKKVESLQSQVRDQNQVVNTEKSKLKALKQQLDGAESNLKGIKMQAKVK